MGLGSGIRDPGSGKNRFRFPDPGVKKAPDPGSGSATLGKFGEDRGAWQVGRLSMCIQSTSFIFISVSNTYYRGSE
jgi:hypothetical protein